MDGFWKTGWFIGSWVFVWSTVPWNKLLFKMAIFGQFYALYLAICFDTFWSGLNNEIYARRNLDWVKGILQLLYESWALLLVFSNVLLMGLLILSEHTVFMVSYIDIMMIVKWCHGDVTAICVIIFVVSVTQYTLPEPKVWYLSIHFPSVT